MILIIIFEWGIFLIDPSHLLLISILILEVNFESVSHKKGGKIEKKRKKEKKKEKKEKKREKKRNKLGFSWAKLSSSWD